MFNEWINGLGPSVHLKKNYFKCHNNKIVSHGTWNTVIVELDLEQQWHDNMTLKTVFDIIFF